MHNRAERRYRTEIIAKRRASHLNNREYDERGNRIESAPIGHFRKDKGFTPHRSKGFGYDVKKKSLHFVQMKANRRNPIDTEENR
jgi:hypothetical protein